MKDIRIRVTMGGQTVGDIYYERSAPGAPIHIHGLPADPRVAVEVLVRSLAFLAVAWQTAVGKGSEVVIDLDQPAPSN